LYGHGVVGLTCGDAHGFAHESIREQTRPAGTGRDRDTAKRLLRHTTADLRLRGEKACRG